MPVHADAAPVQQQRPGRPLAGCPVHRSADRVWQRDQHDLVALASHAQDPVAVFLAQVLDVSADGLEDPQPEQPEQRTSARSNRLLDCLAAVSIASNCRCVSPSVGDSSGTADRWT